jgi:zinc/manganese transport system permease protein
MAVGLLILPAAAARQWTTRLETLILLAALIGISSALTGLILSIQADLPSGPAIVLCAGSAYLISVVAGGNRKLNRRL